MDPQKSNMRYVVKKDFIVFCPGEEADRFFKLKSVVDTGEAIWHDHLRCILQR
jgi:hypothetical protein